MIGPGSFDRRAGTLGRRSRNRARTIRPFAANLLARRRAAWVGDVGAAVFCARLFGAVYWRRAGVVNYARIHKKRKSGRLFSGPKEAWVRNTALTPGCHCGRL